MRIYAIVAGIGVLAATHGLLGYLGYSYGGAKERAVWQGAYITAADQYSEDARKRLEAANRALAVLRKQRQQRLSEVKERERALDATTTSAVFSDDELLNIESLRRAYMGDTHRMPAELRRGPAPSQSGEGLRQGSAGLGLQLQSPPGGLQNPAPGV